MEETPDPIISNVLRMVNFPKERFNIAQREILEKKRIAREAGLDFVPIELEVTEETIKTLRSIIMDELEKCATNIIKRYHLSYNPKGGK